MAQKINLDHQFLVEIGLGHLEPEQQQIVLDKLYRVLELRVGQAMTNSLTKGEHATFDQLTEEGNDEAAHSYLQRVMPDYGFVVRAEVDFIANSVLQSVRRGTVLVGGEGVSDG